MGCEDVHWVCADHDKIQTWVCVLGKESLPSRTKTQNFEIFQNDTDKVVFFA
jgi:hypothetical protein